MAEVLEIALILLVITLIVMFIFATKLLIDISKLVKSIDDASSTLKDELELTIKEINVAIKNINQLTEKPSFKINLLSKLLTSALSISTLGMCALKGMSGGLTSGFLTGLKMFMKK